MINKYSKTLLISAVIVLLLGSCNVTSHTETAAGVNFANYKTFAWSDNGVIKQNDRADNDIVDNNIKNSISKELEKKGWVETKTDPDVLLDYTITVKHASKREAVPVYSYPFTQYFYGRRRIYSIWYPSTLIGVRSRNVPFKEGELSINMVDAKTNKLIWQGWAQGDLNTGTVTTKEATAQVKSIFKKFEYPG
jgi:hypothetical protein